MARRIIFVTDFPNPMTKKFKWITIALSLLAVFGLVPFGFWDHGWKFCAVILVYVPLTYLLLHFSEGEKVHLKVMGLLMLPPAILFLPGVLLHFYGSTIALPSTWVHFLAILIGGGMYYAKSWLKVALGLPMLILAIWMPLYGFSDWVFYCQNGTVTGEVEEAIPPFEFIDQDGQCVDLDQFRNKLVLLDFWNITCSVCYRQFPELEAVAQQYADHPDVEIYSVYVPTRRGTLEDGQQKAEELGYDFSVLYCPEEDYWDLFRISGVPKVLILQNGEKIVYRGNLEKGKARLAEESEKISFSEYSLQNK